MRVRLWGRVSRGIALSNTRQVSRKAKGTTISVNVGALVRWMLK
jgi:hypothetical protein